MIEIRAVRSTFEREALAHPFGFKGGYVTELWQTVTLLQGRSPVVGLGTQSVLWSDPAVFAAHTEAGGNALMYAVSEFALQAALRISFDTPLDLLDALLPDVYHYAKRITDRRDLRKTFVLNALVSLDNAAWLLYADEKGRSDGEEGGKAIGFDAMIPESARPALGYRHDRLASVPAVSYGTTDAQMRSLAQEGSFVVKIKLGAAGSQNEMIEKDKRRIEEVHRVFGGIETNFTGNGRIAYYLDMNGRYEDAERLEELLSHIDALGALEHVLIVEEPFPETYDADVSGLGVRLAGDESAHTDEDVARLIDMGYGAIALKPVAKTLSMTLKIAAVAHERGIPCFCADLTVNPILVDWNKVVAARLAPLPGLDVGLLETNGHQNYLNWSRMQGYHPCAGAAWTRTQNGVFDLDADFYRRDGGIFATSRHYLDLASRDRPPNAG